jgi:hypothetical protein
LTKQPFDNEALHTTHIKQGVLSDETTSPTNIHIPNLANKQRSPRDRDSGKFTFADVMPEAEKTEG